MHFCLAAGAVGAFSPGMIYHFADCELDTRRHQLHRAGAAVHVEPQVFTLLTLLAAKDGDVLSTDEMMQEVWAGRIVSEATVSARISAARKAVGDNGKAQAIIKTLTRVGLQLVVPVTVTEPVPGEVQGMAASPEDVPDVAAPGRMPAQKIYYTASAEGIPLAWAEAGTGPPLLRPAHWLTHLEFDVDNPVWSLLLPSLAAGHRLIRYDQRGTGLSGRGVLLSDPAPGLDDFVDDLRRVADAAGIDRFPVFAASQGVPVAIRFCRLYPERVSRMVLIGGFTTGRLKRNDPNAVEESRALLHLIKSGWGTAGSAFLTAFTALFTPGATPEQTAVYQKMQRLSADPEEAAALRRIIDGFDVRQDVESLSGFIPRPLGRKLFL